MKTATIGAGNMGGSIARGLAKGTMIPASDISVSNPTQGKGKDFNEKTTETGRYSSFGRIFCRLIIRKLSKCFLKTFQEEVRFVHAETQGRQQAEYVRAADTGKDMLFFQ